MSDDKGRYTVSTISKLFNLSTRRIQQLAKDGIIPKAVNGKYDLVHSVKGYITYLQQRATGGFDSLTDFGTENVRVKKLTADKLQLEVDALKGKLIPLEDVENALADIILSARGKLLGLPGRLAKVAIAAESLREIESNAKKIVDEALFELSYDKSKDINVVMAASP